MPEPLLCPDCGWTGTESDTDDGDCPVCSKTVEFVE